MTQVDGYILEAGEYGPRLVLTGPWNPQIGALMRREGVRELTLNRELGWRGQDLAFLQEISSLVAFRILDFLIENVAPVHLLPRLRSLEVSTYCKTPIDFQKFPFLEKCAFEWRSRSESLFARNSLTTLFLNSYTGTRSQVFSSLSKLETLTVANSRLHEVYGLRALHRLRHLALYNLRQVRSLSGIEGLQSLEEVEIKGCKSIDSIDELATLQNLHRLALVDDGSIKTLEPLRSASNLEELYFYGTTVIVDGQLALLTELPRLRRTSFQNRRHYSLRREQLEAFRNWSAGGAMSGV